jgi:hypothetical protein
VRRRRSASARRPLYAGIRERYAEQSDWYLDELCARLAVSPLAVHVSTATMCRWLAALGLRRKRLAVVASQRGTARVQALRETFRRDRQPHLPDVVDGIIAVDQSHADARSAQRTHGRARAGELAVAHQQYNGGKSRAQRISLIAAVGVVHSRRPDGRLRVVSARRVVSGNVTRAVMLSFVDNELAALYRRIRHCHRVELERRGGRAPGAAADSHRH